MLTFAETLTDTQRAAARAFAAAAEERNGFLYKLNVHTFADEPDERAASVLYEENGALAGFASICNFGGDEPEITFVCESERAFDAMHAVAAEKLDGTAGKVFAIVNKRDVSLALWLKNKGYDYSITEYRMFLDKDKFAPFYKEGLEIRHATLGDADLVRELNVAAFGGEGAFSVAERDLLNTKIALLNDQAVGKLFLDDYGGVCGVYGFVTVPEHRGKGVGKALLCGVLSGLLEQGREKIYLEVNSENLTAFALYKSVGFAVRAEFDYYCLNPAE